MNKKGRPYTHTHERVRNIVVDTVGQKYGHNEKDPFDFV